MLPDPALCSSSFGRLGGKVSRVGWVTVLLVSLAGCGPSVGFGGVDLVTICLEETPGDVGCCPAGDHIDDGSCCPDGSHLVRDVEHADWTVCLFDKAPADAGTDAGIDPEPDAGADAP